MGGNYSYLPSEPASNNFFCITFRVPDSIKVIDCDPPTLEIVRKAIARGYRLGLRQEYDKYGSRTFVLAGNPFKVGCSKEEAIAGKQVACTLLQDLAHKGWQVLNSSELCRNKDLSSWFFERTNEACVNYDSTVCCIALSGFDKFQLVNFPKQLLAKVADAVRRTWTLGIQEEMKDAYGSMEMKMNGNPWSASERGAVEARRMILEIIRAMASEGYVLCMSTSIKDTTDSLFFRSASAADQPSCSELGSPDASFVLSLNRHDRLRLIEAPSEAQEVVRNVLLHHWTSGLTGDRDYHGSREFKLGGSPWWTEGAESVRTRLLITLLLQELRDKGWRLVQTIELCRRLNDKSVFVFARAQPESSLHWCLSLHSKSVLRFVNAPVEVVDALRLVIAGNYIHGIKTERVFAGYHQVRLRGRPWSSHNGNDHVHGRHMMLGILEAMQQRGWSLVCSADVSAIYHHADSGQDYPVDVHSLWFGAINKKPPIADGAVGVGGASSAPSCE
ncbi:hypothetical protein BOX15_Mlig033074g3 [Macrostomum lignano]|uniref:Uncharacterized protein n=1 Tax=Macrostomum lignano TaxID=282301 RepID=A0A267FU33_9PLAT|nr:hypothetical protein BOX15_Mlig033074g3 [Macrostomum lignano]